MGPGGEKKAKVDVRRLLVQYVWPDRGFLGVGCGALVVSAFSNAYAPKAMGRVIDAYSRLASSRSLRRELGVTAAVFLIGAVASGLRVKMFASLLERSLFRLRCDLYRACLARRVGVFEKGGDEGEEVVEDEEEGPEAFALCLDQEARVFCATFTEAAQNALRFFSSVSNGAASLIGLNARLALELVCAVPLAALCARRLMKGVSKRGALALDAEAQCGNRGRDCLTRSMRFVRGAAAEKFEFDVYRNLAEVSAEKKAAHGAARGLFHGMIDALAKTVVLAVVARGGALVESGQMTAGDLLSFGLYSGYFALGLAGLGKFFAGDLARGKRAAKACIKILDNTKDQDKGALALLFPKEETPLEATSSSQQQSESVHHLELRGASLRYPGGSKKNLALDGASLVVKRGEIHGIAGASGAGKSSIFALLLNLYEAEEKGTVFVDGIDLSLATGKDIAQIRGQEFAVAEQSAAVVTRGTIEEAIEYPPYTDGSSTAAVALTVREAADLADIGDFAESVGYATHIGTAGAKVSGGQRARLALARALRRASNVILLGEFTASLDNHTETRVLDAVFSYARANNKTLLAITHSTEAMARCDTISVLHQGRVVESGTFASLSKDPKSHLSKAVLLQQ